MSQNPNEVVINITAKDAGGFQRVIDNTVKAAADGAKKIGAAAQAAAGAYNENAGFKVTGQNRGADTNQSMAASIQRAMDAEAKKASSFQLNRLPIVGKAMGEAAVGGVAGSSLSAIAAIAGPAALAATAVTALALAANEAGQSLKYYADSRIATAGAAQATGTGAAGQGFRAQAQYNSRYAFTFGGANPERLEAAARAADFNTQFQRANYSQQFQRASEAAALQGQAWTSQASANTVGMTDTAKATAQRETAAMASLRGSANAGRQARLNDINNETNSQINAVDSAFGDRVRLRQAKGVNEADATAQIKAESKAEKELLQKRAEEQKAIVEKGTDDMLRAEQEGTNKRIELAKIAQEQSLRFAQEEMKSGITGQILGNMQRGAGLGMAAGIQQSMKEAAEQHRAGLMTDSQFAAAQTSGKLGLLGAARQAWSDRFAFNSETMDVGALGERIASGAASVSNQTNDAATQAAMDAEGVKLLGDNLPDVEKNTAAAAATLERMLEALQTRLGAGP